MSKQKTMNVSIVCDKINFDRHGGSNFSIHRLATELTDRGHDVEVVTLNFQFQNDPPADRDYDVIERSVDSYTDVDGVVKALGVFDEIVAGRDVIHCYLPGLLPLWGLWRKRGGKTPVIGHLNTYTPICSNSAKMADGCWKSCTLRDKLEHADESGTDLLSSIPRQAFNQFASIPLMNHLDGIFALSPALADIYRDVGVNDEIIHVVPNLFDREFSDHETQQPAIADGGENPVRIAYIGRVDPHKGVDTLLSALGLISQTDNWVVDICGDDILNYGQDLDEYRDWADELGIGDRVTFHGWVDYDDLPQFYEKADIFVHPGRWPEPFGRTLLEALQHNCAIVTSDVGAPPWIAGNAGVTFPRDNTDELASWLQQLVENEEQIRLLQKCCPEELERFNPDSVIEEIESQYRGVIA